MTAEPTTRQRVLSAMVEAENTFIIPSNDPLRIEEHWIGFKDGREKAAVIWLPPVLGKKMHSDGLFVVLETYPADREALRVALLGYGTGPLASRSFLCKLSSAGLREAIL